MEGYHGRLGSYFLGKVLGTGQYSKVRLATEGFAQYALKYIKLDKFNKLEEHCRGLVINEAKVILQLDHPRILKLYECSGSGVIEKTNGSKAPVAYLVYELMEGGQLFDYVADGGILSESTARYYFKQLISALEFMHKRGFAHRDIKVENVLLDQNYQLKLADFGFSAPIAGKDGSGKLLTSKGTTRYLAPEISEGIPYSGEKVDIFACGVLLFVVTIGFFPFPAASKTNIHYMTLLGNSEKYWERVTSLIPSKTITKEFIDLFHSMVYYDPDKRATIKTIKAHPWFNGPVPSDEEIKEEFKIRRFRAEHCKVKMAEEIAKKKAQDQLVSKGKIMNGAMGAYGTKAGIEEALQVKVAAKKMMKPIVFDPKSLFTTQDPDTVMEKLREYFEEQQYEFVDSEKKYKIQANCMADDEKVLLSVSIQTVEEGLYCIKMDSVAGDLIAFWEVFKEIRVHLIDAKIITE